MSNLKEICENFDATIAAVKNTYQTKIAELETEIEKLQLAATKPPVENTLHESTNPFEDKAKIEELEIVKTQLAALTNELATTKANLEATEAKRKSVWKKYDNLMAQVNIIRENHKQELEKAQGSVSESITAKDAEITTLKARVGELVDEVKKLNAVIAEHERNEVNQSAYIDKLTEEFDMKTVSVSVAQRRCEEAEAKAKQLESTNAAQNLEIKRLADLNKQLAANIEAYKIENERLARNNEQHVKNVGVYKANEQYMSEQITRLKAENEQHTKNAGVYKANEKLYTEQINALNAGYSLGVKYQLLMNMITQFGSESLYAAQPSEQNNIHYTVNMDSTSYYEKAVGASLAVNAIIQYFNKNNTLPEKIIYVYPRITVIINPDGSARSVNNGGSTVLIIRNHGLINRSNGKKEISCSRKEYVMKRESMYVAERAYTLKDGSYIIDDESKIAEDIYEDREPVSNSVIINIKG